MKTDILQGIIIAKKAQLYGYPHKRRPLSLKIQKIVHSIQHIAHASTLYNNSNAVFSTNNIDGDMHEAVSSLSNRFRKKKQQ